jgi:hypothetical protein
MSDTIHELDLSKCASGSRSSSGCETIGYSVDGRALEVYYCGNARADLRIFILAGQHGDESDARKAAEDFLEVFQSGVMGATVYLATLINANPDGSVALTRRNASNIDLNRDHCTLCAPETSAIHCFVDRWQPDVVLDIHTYRPWRRELLPYDLVFPQDIMIDFPTNPAVRAGLAPELKAGLLSFVKMRMTEASLRCDRYTLVRLPGIVRHSSVDILDARNSLALRFNLLTVLIEGRRTSPDDSSMFTPPHIALRLSIEAVVEWAAKNAEMIKRRPSVSGHDDVVPLRCRYSGSTAPRYMEMQSASRGDIHFARIPGDYLPSVKTTRTVRMPKAYAVPREMTELLEILKKQRFRTISPDQFSDGAMEVYRVERLAPSLQDNVPDLPLCTRKSVELNLSDFVLFPTDQQGGHLLALLLEPESQFGPHRIPALAAALQPGMTYSIARVQHGEIDAQS